MQQSTLPVHVPLVREPWGILKSLNAARPYFRRLTWIVLQSLLLKTFDASSSSAASTSASASTRAKSSMRSRVRL